MRGVPLEQTRHETWNESQSRFARVASFVRGDVARDGGTSTNWIGQSPRGICTGLAHRLHDFGAMILRHPCNAHRISAESRLRWVDHAERE